MGEIESLKNVIQSNAQSQRSRRPGTADPALSVHLNDMAPVKECFREIDCSVVCCKQELAGKMVGRPLSTRALPSSMYHVLLDLDCAGGSIELPFKV